MITVPCWVYPCGNCGDVQRVEPAEFTWRWLVRNGAALCDCTNPFPSSYMTAEMGINTPTS